MLSAKSTLLDVSNNGVIIKKDTSILGTLTSSKNLTVLRDGASITGDVSISGGIYSHHMHGLMYTNEFNFAQGNATDNIYINYNNGSSGSYKQSDVYFWNGGGSASKGGDRSNIHAKKGDFETLQSSGDTTISGRLYGLNGIIAPSFGAYFSGVKEGYVDKIEVHYNAETTSYRSCYYPKRRYGVIIDDMKPSDGQYYLGFSASVYKLGDIVFLYCVNDGSGKKRAVINGTSGTESTNFISIPDNGLYIVRIASDTFTVKYNKINYTFMKIDMCKRVV